MLVSFFLALYGRMQHTITTFCDISSLAQARSMMLCMYTSYHDCRATSVISCRFLASLLPFDLTAVPHFLRYYYSTLEKTYNKAESNVGNEHCI